VHRLIARDPGRRPRSALAVLRYLNQHVVTPYPIQANEDLETILKKPPWVRREREESRYQDYFGALRDRGTPELIGIAGPTGIGRTRLLQEWSWEQRLKGDACHWIGDAEQSQWWARAGDTALAAVRRLAEAETQEPEMWIFSDLHRWSAAALKNGSAARSRWLET